MTAQQYLFNLVAEECNEVAQRALKCARFGAEDVQDGQELDNKTRLRLEVEDLKTCIKLLEESGLITILTQKQSYEMDERKREKIRKYAYISRDLNQLTAINIENGI